MRQTVKTKITDLSGKVVSSILKRARTSGHQLLDQIEIPAGDGRPGLDAGQSEP